MLELVLFWMLAAGVVVAGIGHFWLLLRAFRVRLRWGFLVLLVPPASLLFLYSRHDRARAPFAVIGLGVLLMAAPYGVNAWYQHHLDLGPREKIVDGELHLTLTGWDRDDYSVLRFRPQTVVLQMANSDVTDATLLHLHSLKQLRELDLNDTQITDDGLKTLATLRELQILRLRATPITEAGFRESLLGMSSLRQLDLRQTAVTRATVKEWRDQQPDRRALR